MISVEQEANGFWVKDEFGSYYFGPFGSREAAEPWRQKLAVELGSPRYYADLDRHLVCVPYSRANLLAMADDLGIPRHWLHGGRLAHIDIPARSVVLVTTDPRVAIIPTRELLAIAQGGPDGHQK